MKYVVFAVFSGTYFPALPQDEVVIHHQGDVRIGWAGADVYDEPEVFGPFDTAEEAEAFKEAFLMRSLEEEGEGSLSYVAYVLPVMPNFDEFFG